MAPSKTSKSSPATAKPKKEKVYHPQSRKADQLTRKAIRKGKMGSIASIRTLKQGSKADIYGFFYHALPEEGVLSLEELHTVIRDMWLTRNDEELEQEQAARRKGRPKSVKEMKLQELQLRESEEYRTGLEVIDLTHPVNVQLFRQWDQKEPPYVDMLRFLRLSSTHPESVVVSRPGKHKTLIDELKSVDVEMQS